MYNRYIPQSDGTYRRNRVQEPPFPQASVSNPPKKPDCSTPPEPSVPAQKSQGCPPKKTHANTPAKQPPCRQDINAGSFLKQLLPKDFDTGDLFIVLLLLLMAGDCQEDQNIALLTLALYFFM